MVWCGLFPAEGGDYSELREALDQLKLSDAALVYEPETSRALGFGFRCGFLGLLHMDIVKERLEREFDLELIATAPNVEFHVIRGDEDDRSCTTRPRCRCPGRTTASRSRSCCATVITPSEYLGPVLELCQARRGELVDMQYLSPERAEVHYMLPLAEIVFDFFDQLKSRTRGYASLDYEPCGYERVRPGAGRHPAARRARRRVLAASCTATRRTQYGKADGRAPARADPAAAVRRRDPGRDRFDASSPARR